MTDTNNFILTTDADVQFTPESVEALLDLMLRDTSVGAVCARTYPLGSGPVVWYQKFEYAVGHWFQKVCLSMICIMLMLYLQNHLTVQTVTLKKNICVNMILFVLHDTLKYMIINMLGLVKTMTDYSDVVFYYG